MSRASLTPLQRAERRSQIAEYLMTGVTLAEAAKKFGVSVTTAWVAQRQHLEGLPEYPAHTSRRQRAKHRVQIARFVKSGHSLMEAAQRFGVALVTVEHACREHLGWVPAHAVHRRQRGPKYWAPRSLQALALLQGGKLNQSEIARQLGLSRERVRQVAKKAILLGILKPEGKKWRLKPRRHSSGASATPRRQAR